ncbi:MAG: hypothetical protein IJT65_00485 [Eubacterium sp.]|nr:hypothetical protein [Eubacterium sp.]
MKKIISILLALSVVFTSFIAFTSTATAKETLVNVSQKQQFNSQTNLFNFSGSTVAKADAGKGLYYAKSLNAKGKKIDGGREDRSPTIYKGYVYFVDVNGSLKRVKTNGKSKKVLVKGDETKGVYYIIYRNKIYYNLISYSEEGVSLSAKLYSCNLNGKNKKYISKSSEASSIFAYENKVYFISGSNLKRYNIKTKKVSNVKKGMSNCSIINMEGNNIYYLRDAGNEIYAKVTRYNVKSKKTKNFTPAKDDCDGYVHNILSCLSGSFVVTGTGAGDAFAKINGSKFNYEPYYSKYNTCGSCLAYYKNYIVVSNFDNDFNFKNYVKMVKVK